MLTKIIFNFKHCHFMIFFSPRALLKMINLQPIFLDSRKSNYVRVDRIRHRKYENLWKRYTIIMVLGRTRNDWSRIPNFDVTCSNRYTFFLVIKVTEKATEKIHQTHHRECNEDIMQIRCKSSAWAVTLIHVTILQVIGREDLLVEIPVLLVSSSAFTRDIASLRIHF